MKKKNLSFQEISDEIYKLTNLRLVVDSDLLLIEVDRGPRIDHGGGDNGDDWLDDNQQEELENKYKEKHQGKINQIKEALTQLKVKGSVSFDYGEKGHCQISVWFSKS